MKRPGATPVPRRFPLADSGELEDRLRTYLRSSGDPTALRERAHALEWLLAHPRTAEPRLRELLSPTATTAPVLVLEALARIGSRASVPAIQTLLLQGNARISLAAAQALARHRSAEAANALREALRSGLGPGAVSAARVASQRLGADGIPDLLIALDSPDPDLRFHALRALSELGGISEARIRDFASRDVDADVRRLARELSP